MTQSSTDSSLVASLQAYIDACSGPGITLYEGHPAVLMSKARDAISTLERELEEARAAVERQWCLSCGTITRNGTCDCSSDCPETQRLVNYADEVRADASKLSAALTTAEAKVARMGEALKTIDNLIGDSIRGNGEEDYTLIIGGERLNGPAVEFAGYALTTMQTLARSALQSEKDREGEDGR